ncbi:MAG: hypothetical protein IPK82_34925 [Polyangiaceae bacterium]|nr:hypothetical protein [Polyangiaceae bacterium]
MTTPDTMSETPGYTTANQPGSSAGTLISGEVETILSAGLALGIYQSMGGGDVAAIG